MAKQLMIRISLQGSMTEPVYVGQYSGLEI